MILTTVFLDVGGTLIPEVEQLAGGERLRERIRAARRSGLVSAGLRSEEAAQLVARIEAMTPLLEEVAEHHPLSAMSAVLEELGLAVITAADALDAVAVPLTGTRVMMPDARGFLERVRARGLAVIVVSNTIWGTTERLRHDFAALGIADLIDGVVTNADVGARKPDPRIFLAALRIADDPTPSTCVMVGDHERKDVEGAKALGIRTIRLAAGGTPSSADAVAPTLSAAADIVEGWMH